MSKFRVLIPLLTLLSICCVACKISDGADRCSGKYTWDPVQNACVIPELDDSESDDDFDAGSSADAG